MRQAKSKIRFIETFAIVTFPIALAVGCSATGDKTASLNMQEDVAIQQEADISVSDLNNLTYVQTEETSAATQENFSEQQTESDSNTIPERTQLDTLSMETVETMDSTFQNEPIEKAAHLIQTNLQIPEPAQLQKPQAGIFHFAFNNYDVDTQDYALLKEHAEYLQTNPSLVVNVNGYSDNRGSAKNNFEVSKKRAQQIANILMTYGVPESQIKVNGYGESFPLNDENNWEENRRVELEYSTDYSEDKESNGLIVSTF